MSFPLDTERLNQGKIFFSNHLEVLLELLIEEILAADPFESPKIVIPSREMGRWIKREIAERLGASANIHTLFLNEALKNPLPSKLELTVQIYPKIAHLDYVKGDDRRRMILAQTVAGFFSRYAHYGVSFLNDWQKELWDDLNLQIDLTPKGQFHLFAFSHIPEKLFAAFSRSQFYHLSPCEEFWSDLTKYDHLLLGSCGKVGRRFAAMVEESSMPTNEYYLPPDDTSALHQFQRSMLTLQSERIQADDSVQMHLVSTRKREIEVLHHELNQMDVEPKDVLVMAPDIQLYKPYIEALFSDYQIADMPAGINRQVQGLQLMIDLEKRRYSSLAFLELFRHPLFYRQWSSCELEKIREWIQQCGIRWGIDGVYREEVIGRYEEGATFEQGFDQLVESLAVGNLVAFTEAELLGEWIETVRLLYKQRLQGVFSMEAWVEKIRFLCTTFFIESEERLWLFSKLEPLRQKEEMPFEAFIRLMEEELKGEGLTVNPNQLQAYRFSSMLPMRSIPAKVIWLLGMDQEAFPRLDKWLSFDLSRKSHTYSPSRVDFDRYLFLESILSCRERFVISMIGRDPVDNQERPPSSCVSDFLTHFEITPKEHPALSYHEPLTLHDYQLALASLQKKCLEMPFSVRIQEQNLREEVIDIAALMRLSRSPLRHFFQHKLGINFFEEPALKDEEEFVLSPLSFAKLKSEAMRSTLQTAIERAKRCGDYPLGIFEKVANSRCETIREVSYTAIEFHEHVLEKKKIHDHLWHYPAIKVGPVALVGRVEGLVDEVPHLLKKADLRSILSNWPLLLIFGAMQFLDKRIAIKQPLEPFLSYFFEAREFASPLFPTWIKPIVQKDALRLEKEMNEPSFDPALLFCARGAVFSASKLIETWQPKAEKLFGEIIDARF